ncbi:MAG: proline--tRNA ligase, partial [Clostridia bacterium]|nr:proline--tRNA ligase [Clostridia bacterium]
RIKLDDSDNSPGWKYSEYEMKGVPVRIEIGPRDIENGVVVVARRDNGEKQTLPIENLAENIKALLEDVQVGLYEKAKARRDEMTYAVHNTDELKEVTESKNGFIKMMWCGDEACEKAVKDTYGVGSRCIPFEQENLGDVCPICGRPAKHMVMWGKAY